MVDLKSRGTRELCASPYIIIVIIVRSAESTITQESHFTIAVQALSLSVSLTHTHTNPLLTAVLIYCPHTHLPIAIMCDDSWRWCQHGGGFYTI